MNRNQLDKMKEYFTQIEEELKVTLFNVAFANNETDKDNAIRSVLKLYQDFVYYHTRTLTEIVEENEEKSRIKLDQEDGELHALCAVCKVYQTFDCMYALSLCKKCYQKLPNNLKVKLGSVLENE